ncbi:glycosyltransferase [Nocardioides solisilvae]|uniref:glycosyltransferase n=1 Tax=Nocardioides solisilvae TaxID=1542435 RepID=UPI0013A5BD7C|nr:glycosyltransferase [Nocardioides solisilvae]
MRPHTNLVGAGDIVPSDARVVLQVSRWDRLKDMAGVLNGFGTHLSRWSADAHLVLVGPDVLGVGDDPEGAEVLFECVDLWRSLPPPAAQRRSHLVSLPMDDVGENAHLVNALQRHAAVVVQKSLVEGFGLTVTEPMWKGRPVVASAVGGVRDQIVDGVSGLLLEDPTDLDRFADPVTSVLEDDELASRLGAAAARRVRDQYLPRPSPDPVRRSVGRAPGRDGVLAPNAPWLARRPSRPLQRFQARRSAISEPEIRSG